MKRFVDLFQVIVAGLALLTVVLLLTVQPTSAGQQPVVAADGAEIFAARCSGCHGADGSGGVGPALVGEGSLSRFDDIDGLIRFISAGVPGRMPGFETRLSPDEVDEVANYVWAGVTG